MGNGGWMREKWQAGERYIKFLNNYSMLTDISTCMLSKFCPMDLDSAASLGYYLGTITREAI